jgi:alpha-ribazole phosphatase/probable phosphoglycerate mutase
MAVHITYFVHGTTTDNERDVASGWSNVSLSKKGKKQAVDLRDEINVESFSVVFCSDMNRAVETAELVFEDAVEIIKDKRLRECNYGVYNGRPSSIVEPLQMEYVSERFPEGESYEDVRTRIVSFLDFLKKNYDGKRVAIVSHKAPQLVLDVVVKGKSWEEAFAEDWRKRKAWQPGWEYVVDSK